MKEDFLHYLWQVGKFDLSHLKTSEGKPIQIINRGQYNRNAGPDFLDARIRIGDMVWTGQVEIHLQSSDWYQHRHQADPAYENVILHVVLEEDRKVYRPNGSRIATLELKDRIPAGILGKYKRLAHHLSEIPCERMLPQLDQVHITQRLENMAVRRLDRKASNILEMHESMGRDVEQLLFALWCKYMGGRVNSAAYEQLARKVNVRKLWKKRTFLQQIEAYLFGLAGLIPARPRDVYPQLLKREFQFLQRSWNIQSIDPVHWRFFRMRPPNFPTVRLAQLSMIYHNLGRWMPWVLEANVKELEKDLCVQPSAYWNHHYVFDKKSENANTKVGRDQFHKLLINVVIPFRYALAKESGDAEQKEEALELLAELPPENNRLIRLWKSHGISARNALESQALIEQKTNFCDHRKCMRCSFGNYFLNQSDDFGRVEEAFVTLQPL